MQLIRVLVYEGSPEFISNCFNHRAIKGTYQINEKNKITEAIVGDIASIIADTLEAVKEGV